MFQTIMHSRYHRFIIGSEIIIEVIMPELFFALAATNVNNNDSN